MAGHRQGALDPPLPMPPWWAGQLGVVQDPKCPPPPNTHNPGVLKQRRGPAPLPPHPNCPVCPRLLRHCAVLQALRGGNPHKRDGGAGLCPLPLCLCPVPCDLTCGPISTRGYCLVWRTPYLRGGGGWHKASVFGCLPLAAHIGLSPLPILTLCGSECVLVVSTEPLDDLSEGGGGADQP